MPDMVSVERLVDRTETSVPLYVQIAEGLLDRIESSELTSGDRLPSERELSEKLGVNRLTLRRALRVLEDQGLLIRRRGSGTYVAEPKIEWQAGQLIPFTRGANAEDTHRAHRWSCSSSAPWRRPWPKN